MNLLRSLYKRIFPSIVREDGTPKTTGELVSEISDGANLIEGKQTWELAKDKKHDLDIMKKCCDAEIETMDKTGLISAPFYFERVAILSRKEKKYKQEIFYCEKYIERVESFYKENEEPGMADLRKGPRYKAIVNRLPKAKLLYEKHHT